MKVVGFGFILGPLVVLLVAGILAIRHDPRRTGGTIAGLVAVSTVVWLAFVGLLQHETPCSGFSSTGCPTVYGYEAPLRDGHPLGSLLLLSGFLIPAAWAGWRRLAPPLTVGASLAVGPTLLAYWTAPQGDNDGLWVLVFWYLPALGGLAAVVAAVADRVGATRRGEGPGLVDAEGVRVARSADRLAALAIDVAIVGAVLVVPLNALSNAGLEVVAAGVGMIAATLYLGVTVAWRAQTVGQSLVGVSVVDAETGEPPSFARSILRSLIVVLEVLGVATFVLAVPAIAELVALARRGRTLTDRLVGTVVVGQRRSTIAATALP